MIFDIRSLLVAVALATTFCAAARFLLLRMHPHVPGLAHWAWAGVLAAGALVLLASHKTIPDILSLSTAQVLVAGGFTLAWDGFRRFFGRPPLSVATWATIALVVLVPITIAHITASFVIRATTSSAVIAIISALVARELLRGASPAPIASRATAFIYATNALFFVIRGFGSLHEATTLGLPQSSGLTAYALLWWLCVTVAVTLGMALMTAERLQDDLNRQASQDPLTGAINRRAFALVADKEVARARRGASPLSVLMMDLDHFKRINDQFGHAAGDDALRLFATVAKRTLRGEDVFCRFGGEEFVALLPGTNAADALVVAERLRVAYAEATAKAFQVRNAAPFIFTVSVGIGQLQPDEELESTLRRADAALYQAKSSGRNRCAMAAAALDHPLGVAAAL